VNVAVAVGLPTALPVGVTSEVVRVLVPLYAGLGAVGVLAGVLAAYPVATCPPGAVTNRTTPASGSRVPEWASLDVLGWRTLVPTTATLTTFVAFVVLVAGLAGAAGPVFAAEGVTVTEPGSTHPISSKVPEAYADAVRDRGIEASGEILLFEAVDGQPFTARGAVFGPFANVSNARLAEGRPHTAADEAVIGAGLARTLDVGVGESLTLGGSTREGIARVEVVGVFEATGATDDQLVVSLATARHLSGVPDETVQFVRAERLPRVERGAQTGAEVVSVEPTAPVVAGEQFDARVTVRNFGLAPTTRTVEVGYRGATRELSLSVPATATRRATVSFDAGDPGEYELRAGNRTRTVTVREPDQLSVSGLSEPLPVGSERSIRVTDATGTGIGGVTVSVGGETRRTRGDGRVRLPALEAGEYDVRLTAGDRSLQTRIAVDANATREPVLDVRISPSPPSQLDRPEARITLSNPWNRTLVRTVRVEGPGTATERTLRLTAGERTRLDTRLARRSPGSYEVTVSVNGTEVATTSYRVTGDDRVVAALASSGQTGTTGVSQAAASAFGNLQVVLGVLVGLAGLMTVGGTTATFAGAVHARRQTLGVHRATGATPVAVFRLVLRDAVLVGIVGAALATALAQAGLLALGELGFLTAFGVRIEPTVGVVGLLAALAGGVGLTLLGAGLATVSAVLQTPSALFGDPTVGHGGESDG
jgi:hypothetical protein